MSCMKFQHQVKFHLTLDFTETLVITSCGTKYVLVMVKHFNKQIELVTLPQNSLELETMAFFFYCVWIHFGALAKVLTNQQREFFEAFEALYTIAFLDPYTTSRNNLEEDGLIKQIIQIIKRDLQKYKLFHGNYYDWNLMLL